MAEQPPVPAPGAGSWIDPYRGYNFKLQIQGVTAGHFTECTGLGIRVDAIRYREAGGTGVVRVIVSLDSAKSDVILPQLDRWAKLLQKVA